eukprot:8461343-Ditylum_brightwellii.AAC.1
MCTIKSSGTVRSTFTCSTSSCRALRVKPTRVDSDAAAIRRPSLPSLRSESRNLSKFESWLLACPRL